MDSTSLLAPKLIEMTPQATPPSAVADDASTGTQKNEFYVYIHARNDSGAVFYVGKGQGDRAWSKSNRNRWWRAVVAKCGYSVTIVALGLKEPCAFTLEKMLIAKHPRGQLCNLTKGGDGPSGLVHRRDSRLKMSVAHTGEKNHFFGKTHTDEVREKISRAHRGKKRGPLPDHVKESLRRANLGRKMSDEARAKMSAAWEGRVITDEWRANLSKAQRGRKHSPEHVKNQADAQRGKKLSEEHKAQIGNFHRGKKLSAEHLAAMSKKVKCGNGMIFYSGNEAARWLRDNGFPKASRTGISYCLNGKSTKAYGFTWGYAE